MQIKLYLIKKHTIGSVEYAKQKIAANDTGCLEWKEC